MKATFTDMLIISTDRLRTLVLQLDRLVDFMARRRILLLKFKEFQQCVQDAEDTLLRTIHDASIGVEVDMHQIVWLIVNCFTWILMFYYSCILSILGSRILQSFVHISKVIFSSKNIIYINSSFLRCKIFFYRRTKWVQCSINWIIWEKSLQLVNLTLIWLSLIYRLSTP